MKNKAPDELYLQKRASTKDLLPGKWDTSIGGHINPGESVAEALKREAYEELRLEDFKYHFIRKYIWESLREKELVYSFTDSTEETPVINKEEIEKGRFWTLQEIRDNFGKDIFTPNFEHEFKRSVEILLKQNQNQ
ncbi:MAG: NUDIX domain-containing protein [Bacteroidales bacterium]|nr:NUDIX domain-containing protein [Bacteroidales bacterium]